MFENKQRPTWMDINDTDCLFPKEREAIKKKDCREGEE